MNIVAGQPQPAGASYDGGGVNFTLFSRHATRVELALFFNGQEQRLDLPARTGDIWHGYVAGIKPGQCYGFRVHGAWQPEQGHRFNPAKLLLDPCAKAIVGDVPDDARLLDGGLQPDTQDSAAAAPKSCVVAEAFDWEDDRAPRTPWGKTVIYEAHVRGLTQLHPAIPAALRGTYAALGHPATVAHLRHLGITAIELLPIAASATEPRLQRLGLHNYWGYNPVAPWATEARYASGREGISPLREFQQAVKDLHAAGIEVLLDVVFNHTAELEESGPVLSLRGIDNASYYWLTPQGDYENWTGCGNTLNFTHPAVVNWTLEALRYWVRVCHVDGFRFDLATVLGREPGFSQRAALFTAIKACPLLSQVKLIAEPWDIGPAGYQAGNYPPPFAEWNDRFRDDVRRFWLHRQTSNGSFARRFAASSDLFQQEARRPHASVNQITAHDGFTLRDLLSFSQKHNQANGENNRDGSDSNFSNNCGAEGLEVSDEIVQRRRQLARVLLTTLLLAQGTPMLLAGDEGGHTQQGNNNAYCQDTPVSWIDWQQQDRQLVDFTAALIRLRQQIPALTADRWWQEGDGSVQWLNAGGRPMQPEDWQQPPSVLQIQLSDRWLIAVNASDAASEIVLPAGEWQRSAPFGADKTTTAATVWQSAACDICVFQQPI